MSYCPRCGQKVPGEAVYCPNCGEILEKAKETKEIPIRSQSAIGHLTVAVNLAKNKPMVFIPALLGGTISVIVSELIGISIRFYGWKYWPYWWASPGPLLSMFFLVGIVSIVSAVISYILYFASIDMSRDAYLNTPLNLLDSINYVIRRIGVFIAASIIGVIMSFTIILIPAVILMFVILVVDEAGIGDSISKAFSVLRKELGDVIILLATSIIGSFVLSLIPFIGSIFTSAFNVIIGLSFIDLYFGYKKQLKA